MPPGTTLTLQRANELTHYVVVNDDGQRRLRELVAAGLMAAELLGCGSEQARLSPDSADGFVDEFSRGLMRFEVARRALSLNHVAEIKLVAEDDELARAIARALC